MDLMLIVAIILFLLVGYWYKFRCIDQIDKIIRTPAKQLFALALCVIVVFVLLIVVGGYIIKDSNDPSVLVFLYGLFSQTMSAYNPEYSIDLQLYSVFVSILGAVFFSGILVSTITNSIMCRVDNYKEGKINYNHLKDHYIIIGANEILVSIINSIEDKKCKILIVSDKKPTEVKSTLYRVDKETKINQIIVYNEHPLNYQTVKKLCVEHCKSIYIIGEQNSTGNDLDNIKFLDNLIKHIDSKKLKKPIKCYLSYNDSYYIMNYCRDLKTSSINIIPFNFYALCLNSIWGIGLLYSKMKDNKKEGESNALQRRIYGKHIIILGYSVCAEEVVKSVILNAHSAEYKNGTALGKTNITIISPEEHILDIFSYKYKKTYLEDITLCHKKMVEYSPESSQLINDYVLESKENVYIVCCSNDSNKNIMLANGLPRSVNSLGIPVLVKVDYFMPCNHPLDNKGKQVENIRFFGNFDQYILETIDSELRRAQVLKYICMNLKFKKKILCDTNEAYKYWFREYGSNHIENSKMISMVNFLGTLFDSMGLDICAKEDKDEYNQVFSKDQFLSIIQRQQCAYNLLTGYDTISTESIDLLYDGIVTWLELNNLGLKSREK